ncbi:MAG: zf-HC2 domain-containing protein [Candidatus Omnitrophica bacterium]|nr:zf-HC2 domain-containing protein [Candidatus Omnitrophota bacterium]
MKINKCKNIRKFLFEYTRSELDPERQRAVQKHLESCPGCSAYFQETVTFLNPITYQEKGTCPDVTSGLSPKEITDNFWSNYDTKLFERLENTRNRIFFQLELPKLRPVITETLAGLLVLFVLLAMIEKGLGYDLKTYLYLLKQVW